MKKSIIYLGIIFALVLVITSCEQDITVSPASRLDDFETSINTESRSDTIDHIHSDASIYDQIDVSWWESSVFRTSNNPFSFSVIEFP